MHQVSHQVTKLMNFIYYDGDNILMTDHTEEIRLTKGIFEREYLSDNGWDNHSVKQDQEDVYHNDSDHHDPSANSICTYIRIIWSAFPL